MAQEVNKSEEVKEVVVQAVFESSPTIMYRYRCREAVKAGDYVIVESVRVKHMSLAIAKVDAVLIDDAKASKYVIAVVDDRGHTKRMQLMKELAEIEAKMLEEAESAFVRAESIKILGEDNALVKRLRAIQAELG
jgi:hypothetical protein